MVTQLQNKAKTYKLNIFLPYIVLCAWCFFLLITIFNSHAYIGGIDSYFHINSIYNDAMQIKTGNYNYFLSNYGFSQSGRIVSALYAPGVNYVLGWILLHCGTWTHFEILIMFLSLFIGCILMYLTCLAFHMHRGTAILCSMMSVVTHTIVVSWIGNQEFTGLGELLFPIVFLIGIRISQSHHVHPLLIAFMLTFFLQLHLFTSLLAGIVISIYLLDGFIFTNHKKQFLNKTLLAGLWTFGLNGNVFGAIQDVYGSNHLMPTYPQSHVQPLGMQWIPKSVSGTLLSSGFNSLGLIFSLLLIIPVLVFVFSKIKHQDLKVTSLICLISIVLYSAYFPWDALGKHYDFVGQIIQFPKRFSAPFWIPFLLILGYVFDQMYYRAKVNHVHMFWRILPIIPVLFVVWSWWQPTYNYLQWLPTVYNSNETLRYIHSIHTYNTNQNSIRAYTKSPHLNLLLNCEKKATPDYLPTLYKVNNKNYIQYNAYNSMSHDIYNTFPKWKYTKNNIGNTMQITWMSHSNKDIKVPIVKYAHTHIFKNSHSINPKIDKIGIPTIKQHYGINTIQVKYESGLLFKNAIIMMIVTWLLAIYCSIHYYLKIRNNKKEV